MQRPTYRSRPAAKLPAHRTVRVPEVSQLSTVTGTAPAMPAPATARRSAVQSISNRPGKLVTTRRPATSSATTSSLRFIMRTDRRSGFRSTGLGATRVRRSIRLRRARRCSSSFLRRSNAPASHNRSSTSLRTRAQTAEPDSTIAARIFPRRRQPARSPMRRSESSLGGIARLKW